MELKSGKYIRTDDGFIARIVEIGGTLNYDDKTGSATMFSIDRLYKRGIGYNESNILYTEWVSQCEEKLSHLIKIGDFVNGEQVESIINDFLVTKMGAYHKEALTNDRISSVLTREQYERRSYKNRVRRR